MLPAVLNRSVLRCLLPAAVLAALLLQGCVLAAVPLIVHAMGDKQTATVEIPKPANDVYQAALNIVATRPDLTVTERDDKKLVLAVTRGEQKAGIKAVALDGGKTQLLITADSAQNEQEDQALAQRVAERICERLGVRYTVVQ